MPDNNINIVPRNSEIDRFDEAILHVLAEDGRITVTDLAERIGLSKTPTQVRLRRLIDEKIILGFRAVIDPVRLGLDHVAFAEVKLSDTREHALREFNAAVRRIAEVEECHMIASSFDYLLKVRTSDIRRYRFVLGEKISSLPYVASTSTFVAMETIRDVTR
ncbi:MAG TPA: Lrp/AsnC family transcriptional regulator [Polymorphobacter sp.]|nr:Lrp/AsnC family transcriptional regulator [Polymorphobacter sp.]